MSAASAASAASERRINNRPIIGSGNTINRGDVNVGGIRQNNLAGIGVDPGYGVRPPAYNNWRGAYWGYHQGWANGYWHGYHDNNDWGWGRFATGAAVGVTAWALGSSFYNWGYGGATRTPTTPMRPWRSRSSSSRRSPAANLRP